MHKLDKKTKILTPAIFTLITLIIIASALQTSIELQSSTINITVEANKSTYYIREPITIQGIYTRDGEPVTEALIAMQIVDRRDGAFAYRTITIGEPQETWAANITEVKIMDLNSNPITKTRTNSQIKIKTTVRNNYLTPITVVIAYTIYDNALIPIRSVSSGKTIINPLSSVSLTTQIYIPEWATPGKALISTNVYTDEPKNEGMPCTPERLDYFYILRNEQLEPFNSQTPTSHQTQPGEYKIFLRASPDNYAQPGQYQTHIVGTLLPAIKTATQTTFNIQSDPAPPQASFTYYPTKVYQNVTVTFDASSSSAEGYNDIITRLEWKINDPYNPRTIIVEGTPPNPIVTHTFQYPGTFTVELNVTDNEGLWSTTAKPIIIYPEFGPTANFTYDPQQPYNGTTITFNATLSKPGWSAQTQQFSPIVQYIWNWSDGTQNTTSDPIITHKYAEPGNYTVTLTVVDAVGRTNTTSKIVQVREYVPSPFPWDVNGDGYVGIDDIFLVATHFGETPEDPTWNPRCDINRDQYIGIDDIFEVAQHFGEEAP